MCRDIRCNDNFSVGQPVTQGLCSVDPGFEVICGFGFVVQQIT